MANTKLLHLDSYNISSRKKNERGLGFTKYLEVEIVEVLLHLGLVFVTAPSSHLLKSQAYILQVNIYARLHKHSFLTLFISFETKFHYLGNFLFAKSRAKAKITCKLEGIDMVVNHIEVTYIVIKFMKFDMFGIGHVSFLLFKSMHIQSFNTHE